jgi:hypothetical protein
VNRKNYCGIEALKVKNISTEILIVKIDSLHNMEDLGYVYMTTTPQRYELKIPPANDFNLGLTNVTTYP